MPNTGKPDYHRAIYAAYKMRAEFVLPGLAFDPFGPISVEKNLMPCRYATFCEMHGMTYDELMRISPSPDGFTLRQKRRSIILYNDAPHIPAARKRFTLAHELGHYVLKHRTDGEAEEAEANCFARNLLAPRLLAIRYGVDFEAYPVAFCVSPAAARMCERMRAIDEQYLSELKPAFSDKLTPRPKLVMVI